MVASVDEAEEREHGRDLNSGSPGSERTTEIDQLCLPM